MRSMSLGKICGRWPDISMNYDDQQVFELQLPRQAEPELSRLCRDLINVGKSFGENGLRAWKHR